MSTSDSVVGDRPTQIEANNRFQIDYCEHAISRTILPRKSRHLTRQLFEMMRAASITRADRVLEVGCGMGRFTLLLAERGVQVEGLDLSPGLLDRLRAHGGLQVGIPLHCADALEPPASLHDSYDVVLGFFVLHHLRDMTDAIAAMSQMLKPGGRLVLLDANGWNPLFYLQMLMTPGMTWQGDKGMTRMRPGVVFGAMRNAGLVRPALSRFGFLPAFVVDRPWGSRLDLAMERLALPDVCHAFQIFSAERPAAGIS
ncbi:MAG: class I SAM-dependent methyltransferase [Acidobacteriota bacterium]